ncbi:hypothetical protein BGZ72_004962 [Mortierella alpina]|nr:hypothetical protein BGZ72_004962 [Mortierella alpina]
MAYATFNEQTFYTLSPKFGFNSLDLTQSWEVTAAPLITLPMPPVRDPDVAFQMLGALAVDNDKKSLIFFHNNMTQEYSLNARAWVAGKTADGPAAYIQVATDPSTGIAYISAPGDHLGMIAYNTRQRKIVNTIVSPIPHVSSGQSAVWSTIRKSVLVYGGFLYNEWKMGLVEYKPSTGQWYNITNGATATAPRSVDGSCMASAYNGTKIVMFGNHNPTDCWLYTLDIKTMTWTRGPVVDQHKARGGPVCTVVGDYLIVVGGNPSFTNLSPQPVQVFNLKLNQWASSYVAPTPPMASTPTGNSTTETSTSTVQGQPSISLKETPTPTPTPAAEEGRLTSEEVSPAKKAGIIAGGSLGVLIIISSGVFIIRRRKTQKAHQPNVVDKDVPNHNTEDMELKKNNNNDQNNSLEEAANEHYNTQVRDIFASLDYLSNRIHQRRNNLRDEGISSGNQRGEIYEVDTNYPSYSNAELDPYSSPKSEDRDCNPHTFAFPPPPPSLPMGDTSFPANAYIPPKEVSLRPSPPIPPQRAREVAWSSRPNAYLNKSALAPPDLLLRQQKQQPLVQTKTHCKASLSSPEGLPRLQDARNPQRHSSSIPAVAVQQWPCAQQGQNPQYVPPPPSVSAKPPPARSNRHDPQYTGNGRHDSLDARPLHHDQIPIDPLEDHGSNTMDYGSMYYDRHPNGPQAIYGSPDDDEDYLAMYQDLPMNVQQDHGHTSVEETPSLHGNQFQLNPQLLTHDKTASRLEFYQAQPWRNLHDPSIHVAQDESMLYQESQRTKDWQEEYLLQRQNLDHVRLEPEAKIRALTKRLNHPLPGEQ